MIYQLRQLLNRVKGVRRDPRVNQPLLNEQEIQALYLYARSGLANPLVPECDVRELLIGECLAPFAGSGYEFAENRLFQPGDESRFINWRTYARTGDLYRKLFHEERRPQLWLVIDRRAAMRFGTRRRLKVTAAVRHALVTLYQAQMQQIAVGAVILDEAAEWIDPRQSMGGLDDLVYAMTRPCPPVEADRSEVSMEQVVRQLQNRIDPGCLVLLASDFHDMDAQQARSYHLLAQQHTVRAVHVTDPIEGTLPRTGVYRVAWSGIEGEVVLDCADSAGRDQFDRLLQQRQDEIEARLVSAGIHYVRLSTRDEPFRLSEEGASVAG